MQNIFTIFSFFVVVVIYLVAGILFMKYKRGATGKEVIPNVEFWSSFPGLIKVGGSMVF
jgi:1,2-dihydroxy-3-keto-5-methylthiopentene dioxygenase